MFHRTASVEVAIHIGGKFEGSYAHRGKFADSYAHRGKVNLILVLSMFYNLVDRKLSVLF